MRIANNTAAFNTWTNYTTNLNGVQSSMKKLSTGAISNSDDPAGIGINERMRSQLGGGTTAMQNTENSISVSQTADKWLEKISNQVSNIKSLPLETQGTGENTDEENVQAEFKQLQDEISRITSQYTSLAKSDGLYLFKGGNGAETTNGNAPNGASTDEITNTIASPVDSTGQIEEAIGSMSNARKDLNGQQVRIANTRDALMRYEDNVRAAETKVRDIDMARESSTVAKYQTLTHVSTAMLSQANQLPGSILKLIG